jgi:hypothetical protein
MDIVKNRDGIDRFELSCGESQGFVVDMLDEFIYGKDEGRDETRFLSLGQDFPEEMRRSFAGKDHQAERIVLFDGDEMVRHLFDEIL